MQPLHTRPECADVSALSLIPLHAQLATSLPEQSQKQVTAAESIISKQGELVSVLQHTNASCPRTWPAWMRPCQ